MRVDVRHVDVEFGGRNVLEDVSASFSPGHLNVIMGPSGSGKTTLLAVVAGVVKPSDGGVSFYTNDQATEISRGDVAWVMQANPHLVNRTVLDNLRVAWLADGAPQRTDLMDMLSAVQIDHLARRRVRHLSAGERQRLAVARALMLRRTILLADEPTSDLDRENTEIITELLVGASVHSTIIVATHDPLVAARASHVLELR